MANTLDEFLAENMAWLEEVRSTGMKVAPSGNSEDSENRLDAQVNVRVLQSEHDRIRRFAERADMSVSAFVRCVVVNAMSKEGAG